MTVQRWITIHALISALLVSQVGLVQPEFVTHQVPAGWTIETVDTHAIGSSLAVDGDGNPHVTYRDLLSDALKYAYRLGNDWQFEAVASGGIRTSSLALDQSDLPHIVYTTWDLERLRSTLRYMFKDNNGWHSETIRLYYQYIISYPSLSLGPGGVPCVVYYIPDTDPIDGGLMYAYRDAQGWHHEKVSPQQVSRAALDIDADSNPHIAYQSNFRLDHAYRDTGGWHSEVIDEGEVVGGVSLAFDDEDIPHVAYYDYSSASLNHAFKDGLGWHVETVAAAPREVEHLDLAVAPAPVRGSDDQLRISYSDDGSRILKYVYRDAADWHAEVVDNSGQDSFRTHTSIGVDSLGAVYISYTCFGEGHQELRLATNRLPTAVGLSRFEVSSTLSGNWALQIGAAALLALLIAAAIGALAARFGRFSQEDLFAGPSDGEHLHAAGRSSRISNSSNKSPRTAE